MTIKSLRYILLFAGVMLLSTDLQAGKLDDLLQQVKQSRVEENQINKQREQEFINNQAQRQQLLNDANTRLANAKSRGEQLKQAFDENEKKLVEMEELLQQRMGNMGELFGVVRQVAGDTRGVLVNSLVSAQIKGRTASIDTIVANKQLPSTKELEGLWYSLLEEMGESGKVVKFTGTVTTADGVSREAEIIRVGVFNTVTDGKFLSYSPETDQLLELPRQPQARYGKLAAGLQAATSGYAPMAVDPSRGSILSLLVQAPGIMEKIKQGKTVGYIIIGIAIFGIALALVRMLMLTVTAAKVRSQLKSAEPKNNNPLGRILSVYNDNQEVDTETLEYKIDEAILRETPKLQRGLSIIKILAGIAPLLGLLGTVTGMIQTFQKITLFGTGDPKLMADGISQALVTTMLGLMAAIPLLLLYSLLASRSKAIVEVLDEQSAGLIAKRAEQRHA